MNSNDPDAPCKVPPFDGKVKEQIKRFFWWSWHPSYPYWSKSCWGAPTIAEALYLINNNRMAWGLDIYHNKLIREDEGGELVEVLDRPCERMDVWQRCIEQNKETENERN